MSSTHKPRILIVEDNPGDVLLFRLALSDAGLDCEVSEESDGPAALDRLRNHDTPLPDLVVLDLNLPKTSGQEVLAIIRHTPELTALRVVIWTSSRACTDQIQAEKLGIVRYLIKPPEFRDLAPLGAVIREVLNTSTGSCSG